MINIITIVELKNELTLSCFLGYHQDMSLSFFNNDIIPDPRTNINFVIERGETIIAEITVLNIKDWGNEIPLGGIFKKSRSGDELVIHMTSIEGISPTGECVVNIPIR